MTHVADLHVRQVRVRAIAWRANGDIGCMTIVAGTPSIPNRKPALRPYVPKTAST